MSLVKERETVKYTFEGILGNNCGLVKDYVGYDKRLIEKGFEVQNGLPTLRGYAKISDLATVSVSRYKEYQRKEDESHTTEIKSFLEDGKDEAKFLPEIILSVNDISKVVLKKYVHKSIASPTGKGVIENMGYYTLEVTGEALSRVDGNHRLEAGKNSDYYVPFSIILWDSSIWDNPALLYSFESSKNLESEAFLFYFLNNTARHLQLEENYKGLVRAENWTDEELKKVNKNLPLLKYFSNKWLSSPTFECEYLSNPLFQIGNILEDINDDELQVDAFDRIIKDTVFIIMQADKLMYIKNVFGNLVFQVVFYAAYKNVDRIHALTKLILIDKWLERFKYTGTIFTNAKKVYDVVDRYINQKERYIFMAMEYKSSEIVEDYNKALKRAINAINSEGAETRIEFYPIMTGEGRSINITKDIYEKINNCSIFIADITEANANVMYELGIAYNLKKPIILIREKDKEIKVPSDIISDYYYTFSSQYELEEVLYKHTKHIMIHEFGVVFP